MPYNNVQEAIEEFRKDYAPKKIWVTPSQDNIQIIWSIENVIRKVWSDAQSAKMEEIKKWIGAQLKPGTEVNYEEDNYAAHHNQTIHELLYELNR